MSAMSAPPGQQPPPGADRPAPPSRRRRTKTTYRVERPPRPGAAAIAAKIVITLVFAATAVLAVYRAAVPSATPHDHVPLTLVRDGYASIAVLAVVLTVAAVAWVARGAHFADHLTFALLWPIATVLVVIAAGASLVPQHYLRPGPMLVPAGLAAIAMMIAVAAVYNRAAGR